uniref:Uncharacterized LOC100176282 n=1 Tax=Ciona intestinalis TaxID=7719 RepID=F6XXJ3_CIOIN|nr:uncharacterized protein LOC100176282 [Ciona intestinalis]|eukprot:XP_002127513.2 uncharacterized protein LOC100176282 [Ciona intestinalis]
MENHEEANDSNQKKPLSSDVPLEQLKNIRNTILDLISTPEKKRKELVYSLEQIIVRRRKLLERNRIMIEQIIGLANYFSNPLTSLLGISEALKSTTRHLYTVEAYRKTSLERLESKLLEDYDSRASKEFPALKEDVETLLKDASRCILEESRAKYSYDKACTIGPMKSSLGSSFHSPSTRALKQSNRAWIVSMKLAKVQEAKKLTKASVDRVNLRYSEAVKKRTNALHESLKQYIEIDMIFHAKALEQLTEAYRCLHTWNNVPEPTKNVDINDDVPSTHLSKVDLKSEILEQRSGRSNEEESEECDVYDEADEFDVESDDELQANGDTADLVLSDIDVLKGVVNDVMGNGKKPNGTSLHGESYSTMT